MNPLISLGAKLLLDVLGGAVGGGERFEISKLGRVVQKFIQNDLFGPFDSVTENEINPDTIIQLLQGVFGSVEKPAPKITNRLLDIFLARCCPGASNDSDPVFPKTRSVIPREQGLRVDYIFTVAMDTVPKVLLDGPLKGDANLINKIVDSAWQRWIAVCPGLNAVAKESDRQTANLTVRFGALDGTGSKLGEWTGTTFGDVSTHSILIDVSEQWTTGKLITTLTHEIGHALGINHVNDPNAVMAAFLPEKFDNPAPENVQLNDADLAAIPAKWRR